MGSDMSPKFPMAWTTPPRTVVVAGLRDAEKRKRSVARALQYWIACKLFNASIWLGSR